jgi:hypothetical protein
LPPDDVYTRFFTGLKSLSVSKAEHLCNVDYENEMAFVVTHGPKENQKIVGSAFYAVDHSKNLADVAYMILHEWQGWDSVRCSSNGWPNTPAPKASEDLPQTSWQRTRPC